ncbi:MAG: histidinol dehydrogenase [Betaproteobacteria bacterium]|nr:histidinol dehydrogenase [Betaproteobacteria bacterium]MDH5578929.1 histidinol dehydrogenase [Betaproteobacteria bacterium]
MKLRRLSTRAAGFERKLEALTRCDAALDPTVQKTVRRILADVRRRGDAAVRQYTKKFDGFAPTQISITAALVDAIPAGLARALRAAHERIRSFHEKQLQQSWEYTDAEGTRLGQRISALARVGLYVPGGKAAYPSSVLMNAVPAKVAGVGELVMACPNPNPLVLAAAALAGVDRLIRVGGAQAIAALAYGTKSIPRVDKIVGPGNAFVAEAKRQVFGDVGIDMVAGPSEILVIADDSAPADWVAMDLFSQAEHDESAQAILLSPNAGVLDAVEAAVGKLLPEMARRKVIAASLKARGMLVLTRDIEEACDVANRIAPEHLELLVEDPDRWLPKLTRAGAVFLGRYSSEAIGDYCAGPNHVLPTSGTARFSSPLGVYDFQKRTSLIGVSQKGAATLGRLAATLAEGEGLQAHARSAELRFK